MKQEDYFKIMDCVSEEDVIEMMQHRRCRKNLSGEEVAMNYSTHQKKIFNMTRFGVATGTAVAAALLVLNVGFGGFMLHRTDDSVSIENQEAVEVSEVAPETSAAQTEAENNITTEAKQTVSTRLTAAKASSANSKETTTKAVSTQTTAEQAVVTEQSTVTDKPVQQTTESSRNGKLTYSMIPVGRTYELTGSNAKAPIVFHAKAGEQIKMQLTIQNDPGVADFGVEYNIGEFNLLSQTDLQYYDGKVQFTIFGEEQANDDRVLLIGGTGTGSSKIPDGTVLAEYTLLAPIQPGSYVIQEYISKGYSFIVNPDGTETVLPNYHVFADSEGTNPIECDVLGVEIIVDEAENTSPAPIDPETMEGPIIYMESITAHAGQKNVPVNVYLKGCDPFVSGSLRLGYDPALKPLLYDYDTMGDLDVNAESRLGISVEDTLLEDVMLLNSSTTSGSIIMVFFNNYRNFGYDDNGEPIIIKNGETQADAIITEDGVLFTMYFDMPEECGQYQIFACEGTLGGGAQEEPDCLPDQTITNFIPCNITVIP